MAPRDYANRNRKPAARGKAKGSAPARNSHAQPSLKGLMLFIGGAVLLLVLAGWWLLSGKHDSQPAMPTQSKPATAKPAAKPAEVLPEKPQEQWSYITELEHRTVEVDVPDSPPLDGPWQMQCASFRVKEQADALKARIAFQGLESQVRSSQGQSGIWYKVVLGPYQSKRDAERDRHRLAKANINGCQIWRWQG